MFNTVFLRHQFCPKTLPRAAFPSEREDFYSFQGKQEIKKHLFYYKGEQKEGQADVYQGKCIYLFLLPSVAYLA
jgi:hypothetical protein